MSDTRTKYFDLVVEASFEDTDVWIGDMDGHFVIKGTGILHTSLLTGDYTVEFGLGSPTFRISLSKTQRYTQAALEAGPAIPRPSLRFP